MNRRNQRDVEALYLAEKARVSRWFRNSEAGWLFYDNRGRAWHLLSSEAEYYEEEACKIVREWISQNIKNNTVFTRLAFVLAYLTLSSFVSLFVDLTFISPVSILIFLFLTASTAAFEWIEYRNRHYRWRDQIMQQLKRDLRGGVPVHIADHHRRINLFKYGKLIGLAAFLGLGLGCWMFNLDKAYPQILIAMGAMVLVVLPVLELAERRVDQTHRRRKWLD